MSDILQSERIDAIYPDSEPRAATAVSDRTDAPSSFSEAPYPQTERRPISEADRASARARADAPRPVENRQDDRRQGERRQGDRRRGERRGAPGLRDDFQWTVAQGRGHRAGLMDRRILGMKASRLMLLAVALVAGGMAAILAVQGTKPEPRSVEVAVDPAPAPVAAKTKPVLVATKDIAVGERLSSTTLQWQDWPIKSMQADYLTQAANPDAIKKLSGSVARTEFLAGEPIRQQKLVNADGSYLSVVLGKGMRAVSVSISSTSASGGFVSPNDRVDVVLTRQLKSEISGPSLNSQTILHNVRVLAINARVGNQADPKQADSSKSGPDVFKGQATATLELNPTQSEVIINAAAAGQLSLVLRSAVDQDVANKAPQGGINQAIRLTSPFWTN